MSKSRGSPRKFAEKIALLNKKEAEGTAEFVRILEEVKKETTRGPSPQPIHNRHHLLHNHHQQQQQKQYYGLPARSSSFSSRQTCARQLYQPQQVQQQNHNQYLAEPILYNPNNHLQQQQQQHQQRHVDTGRDLYVDPQHQQQQQQQQVQQQQQSAYVDHNRTLAQHLHHQPQQHEQNHHHHQPQQHQHLTIDTTAIATISHSNHVNSPGNQHSLQPTSVEVPNIEIFPIDDEHQDYESQQQMTSAQNSPDSHLSSDHYRQDCSPPSISSSRSLPNIANLSVSPTSTATSGISTTGQFVPQMLLNNQQRGSLAQAVSATNISNHLITNAELAPVISRSNDNSLDNYATHSPLMIDYFANDEYCSLPAIQEPLPTTTTTTSTTTTTTTDDLGRQRQSISPLQDGSWQHVATSSAPCSAAPTPPAGIVQGPDYGMNPQQQRQQQQRSPNGFTSMEHQQHSPNGEHHLHQDYYTTNSQNQIVRRSSTNVIDSIHKQPGGDLLNAPGTNNTLSKSFEAHYGGYLDEYMTSDNYTSSGGAGATLTNGVDNYGQADHLDTGGGGGAIRSANPISRSRSYNDIDQNFQPNDCKRTTMMTMMPTQYSNQQQQNGSQFLDTQQQYNQFYE